MSDRFHRALALTFNFEGGLSSDSHDRGGLTNLGITAATWDAYCHEKGLPHSSVARITQAQAIDVYELLFWDASHAGFCRSPLAEIHFDFSVNSGPGRAVKALQTVLGVVSDGQFGERTKAALLAAEERGLRDLCLRYLAQREAFLRAIAQGDQARFLKGWLRRVETLRAYVGKVLG